MDTEGHFCKDCWCDDLPHGCICGWCYLDTEKDFERD